MSKNVKKKATKKKAMKKATKSSYQVRLKKVAEFIKENMPTRPKETVLSTEHLASVPLHDHMGLTDFQKALERTITTEISDVDLEQCVVCPSGNELLIFGPELMENEDYDNQMDSYYDDLELFSVNLQGYVEDFLNEK